MSYKKEIDNLRQGLSTMKQRIVTSNEEIRNTTSPTLEAMTRDLSISIHSQKEENTKLQS